MDNKEPVSAQLIGKIIAGAIVLILSIVFLGFAVAFEDPLLMDIVYGISTELFLFLLIGFFSWCAMNYNAITKTAKKLVGFLKRS